MIMRIIVIALIFLVVLIQYPLWLGKGGWLKVWDLDRQVTAQKQNNEALQARNIKLAGEVKDLKEGTSAIEERARSELGMVKEGEVFVQFIGPSASSASAPQPASNVTSAKK